MSNLSNYTNSARNYANQGLTQAGNYANQGATYAIKTSLSAFIAAIKTAYQYTYPNDVKYDTDLSQLQLLSNNYFDGTLGNGRIGVITTLQKLIEILQGTLQKMNEDITLDNQRIAPQGKSIFGFGGRLSRKHKRNRRHHKKSRSHHRK
jgi:hypothetical protein